MNSIALTSVAERLRSDGYCRFEVEDVDSGLSRLRAALDELPADPYAASQNRYRRYSPAVLLPWTRQLEWAPNFGSPSSPYTEYFQDDRNPEFPHQFRRFPPLPDALKADPLLHHIVWHDFALTFWSERQMARPFAVGVHLVKLMVAEAGARAISSPDHLHQDGEPFTFVHLVARENAVGASNIIAVPGLSGSRPEGIGREGILAEFELHEPLESYGVHDQAVSHYVSSLGRGPADRPAIRAALLVDFTPLVAALQHGSANGQGSMSGADAGSPVQA